MARKRRRLTAKSLAEIAGIAPVTLSRVINRRQEPDETTVTKLVSALGFPRSFFFKDDPDEIDVSAASFRSLTSMTARERDAALSAGSLAFEISDWVNQEYKLVETDLLDLSHERKPANAARVLRNYWKIGERPIGNIVHFLETKGIRVFSLSENTKNVDAFSCWRNDEAFIFLNTFKTTERSRFDAAHELGHLILHRHGGPNQRSAEIEANEFASSFLMPRADVLATFPYVNSLRDIIRAKKKWGVSAAALSYRLHKMELISDWQYRSFMIRLNTDFRQMEPDGMAAERSHTWKLVLQDLWRSGKTIERIAEELELPSDEIGSLLFGLTSESPVPARAQTGTNLRLVK